MDLLDEVEQRYGIRLPVAYRAFAERGYLSFPGEPYLWVHEAEWIPPSKLLTPKNFYGKPKPGLIPFAFTGGHDLWCWQAMQISESGEPRIAFCPRDSYEGWWHAPSFVGWLYRLSLEYVAPMWSEESETRGHLRRWASLVREFGSPTWGADLDAVARRPAKPFVVGATSMEALLDPEDVSKRVRKAFGKDYIDAKYVWDVGGEPGAG